MRNYHNQRIFCFDALTVVIVKGVNKLLSVFSSFGAFVHECATLAFALAHTANKTAI